MSDKQNLSKYSKHENFKLNEDLIRKNPSLGVIHEEVLYNKEFLLEVASNGYNPLDSEDVQNFIEKKPPKDQNRNIIACGADKYLYLGQGEFGEDDLQKFMKGNPNARPSVRTKDDVYLSDFKSKERELLLEKTEEVNTDITKIELTEEDKQKFSFEKVKNPEEAYRKNLAKVFGSDNISVEKREMPISNQNGIVKSNIDAGELLELIKEFKALGFSNEEIKFELSRLKR